MLNLFLIIVVAWAILSVTVGVHAYLTDEHATSERAAEVAKETFLFPIVAIKRLVQRK